MNWKRKCLNCQESFLPDRRSYRPIGKTEQKRSIQRFCSKPECQKASHQRSNKIYWKKDPDSHGRNVLSCRSWRRNNPHYWKQRRERDKNYTHRNRQLQRRRDAKRQGHLANTDTINALQREKLSRIQFFVHLANTDASKVSWTLVLQEICLYLRWSSHLANTNSMAQVVGDNSQSRT